MEQKKLVERGIPHIPNRKGAVEKVWITAPYQKWPEKMPGALLLPLRANQGHVFAQRGMACALMYIAVKLPLYDMAKQQSQQDTH